MSTNSVGSSVGDILQYDSVHYSLREIIGLPTSTIKGRLDTQKYIYILVMIACWLLSFFNDFFCFSCSETDDDVEFDDWVKKEQPCPFKISKTGKELKWIKNLVVWSLFKKRIL